MTHPSASSLRHLALHALLTTVLAASNSSAAEPQQTGFAFNDGKLAGSATLIVSMQQARLQAKEVLIYSDHWTHKIVVFVYPPDSSSLWMWDPQSSAHELKADFDDAMAIALAWGAIEVPGLAISGASFGLTTGPTVPHCLPNSSVC